MNNWRMEIENALRDFLNVAVLAQCPLDWKDFQIEFLDAPHTPPSKLPAGSMGIYGFWHAEKWLKIGKVGSNSQARYISQHYNPGSAQSTLAKSLTDDPHMSQMPNFDPNNAGDWIKKYTSRVNILLDADKGKPLLALLEAFLHARLRPRYEG
jgi:hypothetical protein